MNVQFRKKGPNAMWLVLLILGCFMGYLIWYNSSNRTIEPVNYSRFLQLVNLGMVDSVAIQDQHVQGMLKNGTQFQTYILPSERLWDDLRSHDVQMSIYPLEKGSWGGYFFVSFLFLLLLSLVVFFLRQGSPGSGSGPGKIFSVGKSKARYFSPNSIQITFKDVAGVADAKDDLKEIVEFLKNPARFERLGAKVPRGVLLSGAPGNGKTLLAKAVAGEAHCPFFSISGSDFVEVFVGVGASRVRDLFAQAKKSSPCIVFIDEIDAVGRQRGVGLGGGNDEREQTLNQLLSEMDGFSTERGSVIILAATNRPDILDKALLRPGRFDRVIEVPYPDVVSRQMILEVHAAKIKLHTEVDLGKIARGTPGFSGADLENLINEAALRATKADKQSVEITDFEIARDKLLLGAERKTLVMSEKEKQRTAFHESGHTLLNVLLPDTDPFHKVTIIPRGRTLGVSWSLPEIDRHSETRGAIVSRIMVCFGGLIAEKMIFNEETSGSSSDLEQATKLAKVMVRQYGMSSLGPISFGKNQFDPMLSRDVVHNADYSDKTAEEIDKEVSQIMNEALINAEKLLRENSDKLAKLAAALLEKETLHAMEVYELLGITPRETHSLRP